MNHGRIINLFSLNFKVREKSSLTLYQEKLILENFRGIATLFLSTSANSNLILKISNSFVLFRVFLEYVFEDLFWKLS